jgi:hypothetical protein
MTDFPQISDSDKTWPRSYSGQSDTKSAGFVTPYKVGSGVTRGTQIFAGTIQVNNPTSNKQVISLSGSDGNFTVTDPTSGLRRILIGELPDGTFGMAVSKVGKDVITDGFS